MLKGENQLQLASSNHTNMTTQPGQLLLSSHNNNDLQLLAQHSNNEEDDPQHLHDDSHHVQVKDKNNNIKGITTTNKEQLAQQQQQISQSNKLGKANNSKQPSMVIPQQQSEGIIINTKQIGINPRQESNKSIQSFNNTQQQKNLTGLKPTSKLNSSPAPPGHSGIKSKEDGSFTIERSHQDRLLDSDEFDTPSKEIIQKIGVDGKVEFARQGAGEKLQKNQQKFISDENISQSSPVKVKDTDPVVPQRIDVGDGIIKGIDVKRLISNDGQEDDEEEEQESINQSYELAHQVMKKIGGEQGQQENHEFIIKNIGGNNNDKGNKFQQQQQFLSVQQPIQGGIDSKSNRSLSKGDNNNNNNNKQESLIFFEEGNNSKEISSVHSRYRVKASSQQVNQEGKETAEITEQQQQQDTHLKSQGDEPNINNINYNNLFVSGKDDKVEILNSKESEKNDNGVDQNGNNIKIIDSNNSYHDDNEGDMDNENNNNQEGQTSGEKQMKNDDINNNNNTNSQKNDRNDESMASSEQSSKIKREQLEEKKKGRIQKFCPKFFKDQLKNRSGIPTLTQNNRTMTINIEGEQQEQNGLGGGIINKMNGLTNGGVGQGVNNHNTQKGQTDGLLNVDLRKELLNIEEHQKYRVVIDTFVKKFSRSPSEAIQFLIDKNLCDDTPEDIAYTLLTTEGLSKEKLGIFFGSNKQRNQDILEAFCSLLDFRGLLFDQAIRLCLSRFRIPGEAQQIDRIVTKFTTVYSKDNPKAFHDEDTPYILCYAAIMLNVDAHSEKIEKKNKMQKSAFVSINLSCTKNAVTQEFLENLFDNIVKEPFETKIDYVEKICSRLPVESMAKQFDGQNRIKTIKALQAGSTCLKYGRQGKPHNRFVWLSEDLDQIMWTDIKTEEQKQQQQGKIGMKINGSLSGDKNSKGIKSEMRKMDSISGKDMHINGNKEKEHHNDGGNKEKIPQIEGNNVEKEKSNNNNNSEKNQNLENNPNKLVNNGQDKDNIIHTDKDNNDGHNAATDKENHNGNTNHLEKLASSGGNIHGQHGNSNSINNNNGANNNNNTATVASGNNSHKRPSVHHHSSSQHTASQHSQPQQSQQSEPSSNFNKKGKLRCIYAKDIIDVALGSNTTEVMKKNKVPSEFDPLCLSIITTNRTLDLQFQDIDTKLSWIAYLYNHLNDQRLSIKKRLVQLPEAKQAHQDRLSDIWRIDVFSKWDAHWDYSSSKPKQFVKYEKANSSDAKKSFFSTMCSCLPMSSKRRTHAERDHRLTHPISGIEGNQGNNEQLQQQQALNQLSEYEELELVSNHKKSLLLISLWKIGMPKWVRKTLWPLAIGNRLEITENLYTILLKQVAVAQINAESANAQIMSSIGKMKEDLIALNEKSLFSSLSSEQKTMIENILSAFIFYRPDIGYIPEAMPNLAAVLIHHIDKEYIAFRCFINLLHSYHFLTFFRGEMSEIKWRVQFFNQYLNIRMPLVLHHFRALDLSSELFLMHWFLNLFSNVFDLETVFRIWDNFLLEGEVFAFKAGIAFIEYFHLEFKMATFEDSIHLLKNPPEDIFCSEIYFHIIEDIKISVADFNDRLAQQNVAKLAPYIMQQLL